MNESTPFDERERRRPGFDPESEPVEFPGGMTLYLPKPRVEIRCAVVDGRLATEPARSWGADYDRLTEAVVEASTGTPTELAEALFALTFDLVTRNYDLTAEEVAPLLVFVPAAFLEAITREEMLPEPWGTVWRIAMGLPPKSSAGSPTPPADSSASIPTG